MKCKTCGKNLSFDEIGLCKKLMGRDITEFFCIDCMADKYGVSRERLQEKIEEFRSSGCLLFIQKDY